MYDNFTKYTPNNCFRVASGDRTSVVPPIGTSFIDETTGYHYYGDGSTSGGIFSLVSGQDIGVSGIDPVNYIQFNVDIVPGAIASNEGKMYWNSTDGTLDIGMPGGNVNLQIGQELHVRAINKQGSQITNGQVVYLDDATGAVPNIKLAKADNLDTIQSLGVATEDIDDNQLGYVTTFGLVRDINTSGCSAGDELFLSSTTAGAFTNVRPTDTPHDVTIGYCLRAHATEGVILTRIDLRPRSFGDVSGGNYTTFDGASGWMRASGAAIMWDDSRFPAVGQQLDNPAGRVDYNYTENTVDFQSNATSADTINMVCQMTHKFKTNSDIHPHLHWVQNQDDDPAWRIDYRIYGNGDQVPSFTTAVSPSNARVFTYVSGNLFQISEFPPIGLSGYPGIGTSWTMDIKLYRVGASDSYTGDSSVKEFDIHHQIDSNGSDQEFTKSF